jgi:CelD/BcsL family acetyltransferase involved in cellulose biosynthesis
VNAGAEPLEARAWQGHAGLAALAQDWHELARVARVDPLCNSHAWTLAHARAFTSDADLFGWTLADERGGLAAILALRAEPPRGKLALRRALLAADGTFDSDYLEPLVRPGYERAAARALLEALSQRRETQALVLAGVPSASPFLAALRAELDERKLPRRERAVTCLAAPLAADLETTVAALEPRMRTKVRAAIRAAEEGGALFAWCERADELERHLAGLYRLHELRWQSAGRPGSFGDPRRRAFYAELVRALHEQGALRFARLDHAGHAVAYQLGARCAGAYYQIQEGFDPAAEAVRAATALRALALERLIAEGVSSYDFMAGDSRHKRDWGGIERPCTTLAFALPRWRARLAYGVRSLLDRR